MSTGEPKRPGRGRGRPPKNKDSGKLSSSARLSQLSSVSSDESSNLTASPPVTEILSTTQVAATSGWPPDLEDEDIDVDVVSNESPANNSSVLGAHDDGNSSMVSIA